MKKTSFLKRIVLNTVRKEVQEEIDSKVSTEKGKWAKASAEEIAKSKYSFFMPGNIWLFKKLIGSLFGG